MRWIFHVLAFGLMLCGHLSISLAGDFPQPHDTQPETVPPLPPRQALEALHVPDGFKVTLFASEPDIRNPIALCTDSRGRLWVAENYTYAEREKNYDLRLRDRIVILEDTDHDGVHDVRKVFWDQGQKLTGIQVGFGGVWVTCAPHLLFLPDRNGDDVPDGPPEILLDGFESNVIRHNIVNGLEWAPDGWLYGRHGIQATSRVGRPGAADSERIRLNCSVWRYHPTKHLFEVISEGTTNPWGMDWDAQGECWLINTVIGHLWHVVPNAKWERMYGTHFNPHIYELVGQTADHYHFDQGEKWSDVRHKGISPSTDAAGGGHAHCGLYCPDATWPKKYQGSILTGNLHGRRLNRDVLHRNGCGYLAQHAPDFITSDDPYFRIVELEHGRNQGMFMADWSDIGECHENDGVHRSSGRIYRLTWTPADSQKEHGLPGAKTSVDSRLKQGKFKVLPPATEVADLADLPAVRLVGLQRHPSEWYARTARRILQERAARKKKGQLAEAEAALRWMLQPGEKEEHRLRAFWGLLVIERLTHDDLRTAVSTGDEHLRSWAVRVMAEHPEILEDPADALPWLKEIAQSEKSGLVLLYIASSLSRFNNLARLELAEVLLQREAFSDDPQLPLILWVGIEPAIAQHPELASELMIRSRMPKVSRFIARRLVSEASHDAVGMNHVVDALGHLSGQQPALRRQIVQGMSEALEGWRSAPTPEGWDALTKRLHQSGDQPLIDQVRELSILFGDGRALDEVRQIAMDDQTDVEARKRAIHALVEARADGIKKLLTDLLTNRDLGATAIDGLAVVGGPDTAVLLVKRYARFRNLAKESAITAFVSRPDFVPTLLDAVEAGQIGKSDVPTFQLRQMMTYGDDALTDRIKRLWPELEQLSQAKAERIRALREQLTPEVLAEADLVNGRRLFAASCQKCHKLFGEGGETAPDITGAQRSNLNYLLENIVDPSATVSKNYKMAVVVLDDGRILNGILRGQQERTITLQLPEKKLTLDRSRIEAFRETELSLMPEGQLDRLSDEEVRDLIGYLMSPRQVPLTINQE